MLKQLLLFLIAFLFIQQVNSQNNVSQQLVRSTTAVSGSSSTISINNKSYIIQQSIGQSSTIGTFKKSNYTLRQGFIQPNVLAKIIDNDLPLNLNAIIYPNPFMEHISLFFDEEIKEEVSVWVYDMLGRVLFTKSYPANKSINVSLQNFSVAHYYIKVRANDKQFIKKIIKK